MGTQEKGKPGPKKGWVAALREELAECKAEAAFLRDNYIHCVGQCNELRLDSSDLQSRLDKFNNYPYLKRVLWVLFGGKV